MHTPAAASSSHVVILALDTLGDLVLRQPLFSELHAVGHRVTVVVRRGYEEVVPFLDPRLTAVPVDLNPHQPPDSRGWQTLSSVACALGADAPHVIVAAAHNRTYAEEWLLHQFPCASSVGFVDRNRPASLLDSLPPAMRPDGPRRAVLFDRGVERPADEHEATKQRGLFTAVTGLEMAERPPRLAIGEREKQAAAELLADLGLESGKYVFGCPGGTVTIPLKAWPAKQFVDVAAHARDAHALPTLIAGVPAERPLLDDIAAEGARRGVPLHVWIGEQGSLATMLGLIAHSRVYVGNDTGPMHCAGALGIPVVARFGGGHWPRFVPLAARAFTATQQLSCFGCVWQCHHDRPHCMTAISTRTFTNGLDWILSGTEDERRIDRGSLAEADLPSSNRGDERPDDSSKQRSGRPAIRPKVFVVTPSFNQGRFIRETIDSVLSQDYENLEYFVADGGSTDGTLEVLRSYGERLRWTSGPDGGQAAAIARAWAECDADIVAWLNSDDTYLPGAISAAVEFLAQNPDADMVYGDAWYTNAVGRRLRQYPTMPFDRDALAAACFICQPATFLRRDVFKLIDPPDARLRFCMDYDLWIRLSQHFQVAYLPRFLANSRLHAENKTLGQRSAALDETMTVVRRHFGYVHPAWVFASVQDRLARTSAKLWPLRGRARQRVMNGLAARWTRHLEIIERAYPDGWAGPGVDVPVESAPDGGVTIDCECPVWPHAGAMRVAVRIGDRILAVRSVRGQGPFSLHFRLPAWARPRASVRLEANRSFLPIQHGFAVDSRVLSYRVLNVRPGADAADESSGWRGLLLRSSAAARFLPVIGGSVSRTIERTVEQPIEGTRYPDGWVGPRTLVRVEPDASGRVTLNCECPVWPFRRRLRVTVFHEGRVLTRTTVRSVGPFTLTFRLPAGPRSATVLVHANLAFVPRERALSEDTRLLSFQMA